jgi:hypothetical protein
MECSSLSGLGILGSGSGFSGSSIGFYAHREFNIANKIEMALGCISMDDIENNGVCMATTVSWSKGLT